MLFLHPKLIRKEGTQEEEEESYSKKKTFFQTDNKKPNRV